MGTAARARSCEQLHILAFEAFDAGSHRAVRQLISDHSSHKWTWITRPGRAWKWRMRLSAIEMIEQARIRGAFAGEIDCVFVTSMTSAADLRALLPEALRCVPLILYMHENQFAYPAGDHAAGGGSGDSGDSGDSGGGGSDRDVHFALTNLTSIMAADEVIWNSQWNRTSFLDGLRDLLHHAPDADLPTDIFDRIAAKSRVIWPPIDVDDSTDRPRGVLHKPIRVVWPHRWEHDKGPDELLRIMRMHAGMAIRWTILGEQFAQQPADFDSIRREHSAQIDHMGFEPDRQRYLERLKQCDWVLSTARHEFFGIAVVEALLCGCLPWLPNRLSYVELLPDSARNMSPITPPDDPAAVRMAIAHHLAPARAVNAVHRIDEAIRFVASRAESKVR